MRDALVGLAVAADDRERLQEIMDGDAFFDESQHAIAALLLGHEERALTLYRQSCTDYETVLRDLINYELLWCIPHAVYRVLLELRIGDSAAAAELRSMLAMLDEVWSDGIVNADTHYWAASALAALDRHDDAIARLAEAQRIGWRSAWWARRDPCFEALRDEPRFLAVLDEAERHVRNAAETIARKA